MSVIEQAAKRLEELRRAGIELPWGEDSTRNVSSVGAANRAIVLPTPTPTLLDTNSRAPLPAAARTGAPKAADQPEAKSSAAVHLDFDRLAKTGFLVPALARSRLATEFRRIKRTLLNVARAKDAGKRVNVIMVTSALPGEGKTFCSINLAMSIAMEIDSSVLLIDADVQRPAVLSHLGLEPARGLLDILIDRDIDLASVLLRTNVPKLTLLSSGRHDAKSNELLASTAMERLLDELANRYPERIIIVDSPPLLLTSEAHVLASRVGQIVTVVAESETPQSSFARALAALEPCPYIYAVLNKCAASSSEEGGYGYYGYS